MRPASSLVNRVKNDGPELLLADTRGETLDLFPPQKD
jgi:hypothetical protein